MRVTRSTRPSTRKGMQRFLWSCMRRGESCGKAIHCDIIFSFMPTSIKKTMPILQYQGVNTLVSNFGRWQCGWTSRCFCGCFTTITMQLLTNFTAGLLCFSCTKLRAWATTPFAHTLLVSALPGLQSSPGWSQFTNWQCPLFFFYSSVYVLAPTTRDSIKEDCCFLVRSIRYVLTVVVSAAGFTNNTKFAVQNDT